MGSPPNWLEPILLDQGIAKEQRELDVAICKTEPKDPATGKRRGYEIMEDSEREQQETKSELEAIVERHREIRSEVEHLYPKELFMEQGSKEWHMQRRGRITGSNLAAAAGLNQYKSRSMLWMELTGRKKPEDLSKNRYVQWGKDNEDRAIDFYSAVTGDFSIQRPGMVLDAIDTWLAVSPDGWAGDPCPWDPKRGSIYLEVKCPGRMRLYDEIPSYYMPQVQGGLSVTRREVAHFICYVPAIKDEDIETGEYIERSPEVARIWEVKYSEEYDALLRHYVREFMGYVVRHERPPRMGTKATPTRIGNMPGVEVALIHDGPLSTG